MLKHLPGQHDQSNHGLRSWPTPDPTSADTIWPNSHQKSNLSLSEVLKKHDDVIKPVITNIADNPPDLEISVSFTTDFGWTYRGALYKTLRSGYSQLVIHAGKPAGKIISDEHRKLFVKFLAGLENFAKDAGVADIMLDNYRLPVALAAKRGYKMPVPQSADINNAVRYLSKKYEIPVPSPSTMEPMHRQLSKLIDDSHKTDDPNFAPVTDILDVTYPGQPELSLFTEYLTDDYETGGKDTYPLRKNP